MCPRETIWMRRRCSAFTATPSLCRRHLSCWGDHEAEICLRCRRRQVAVMFDRSASFCYRVTSSPWPRSITSKISRRLHVGCETFFISVLRFQQKKVNIRKIYYKVFLPRLSALVHSCSLALFLYCAGLLLGGVRVNSNAAPVFAASLIYTHRTPFTICQIKALLAFYRRTCLLT